MPFDNTPPVKTDDEIISDGIRTVLTQARSLVASPEHWFQGDGYRGNGDGTKSFCIEGAINLSFVQFMYPEADVGDVMKLYDCCRSEHEYQIREAIDRLVITIIRRHWPQFDHRIAWNDAQDRRHEDILLVFDQAIAEAGNWVDHDMARWG